MAAAALTFREALEISLVVTVVLLCLGGSAREHVRPVLAAIGAAFLLGATLGAGAGRFSVSLGVKANAVFQASMMVLGVMLMPDRGVSPIATVGIASVVVIARLAPLRGVVQPRPSRVLPAATVGWWSR